MAGRPTPRAITKPEDQSPSQGGVRLWPEQPVCTTSCMNQSNECPERVPSGRRSGPGRSSRRAPEAAYLRGQPIGAMYVHRTRTSHLSDTPSCSCTGMARFFGSRAIYPGSRLPRFRRVPASPSARPAEANSSVLAELVEQALELASRDGRQHLLELGDRRSRWPGLPQVAHEEGLVRLAIQAPLAGVDARLAEMQRPRTSAIRRLRGFCCQSTLSGVIPEGKPPGLTTSIRRGYCRTKMEALLR
jgi:hypothetical protein